MQMDSDFARRVLEDDPQTRSTLGLEEECLSWVRSQGMSPISADLGGKRRRQIVGNIASEYTLSLSATTSVPTKEPIAWLDKFFTSDEFHRAVREDGRLPLAFGRYAREDALRRERHEIAAVVELEFALAQLRREAAGALQHDGPMISEIAPGVSAGKRDDTLWLSKRARLIELPAGTHSWCEELQTSLEGQGSAAPPAGFPGSSKETVLLFAHRTSGPHQPAEVRTERLDPPVDEVLRRSRSGFAREERAAFARAQGAELEDLEGFLGGFLDEGVLEPSGADRGHWEIG